MIDVFLISFYLSIYLKLKELTESLLVKSESVNQLESRISELTSELQTAKADLASKSLSAEQLVQDKSYLEQELSKTKDSLANLDSGRQDNESTIISLQQEVCHNEVGSRLSLLMLL